MKLRLDEAERSETRQDRNIALLSDDVELLSRWLGEIEKDVFAIRASWRWRIGNRAVGLVEHLLLRKKPYLAFDHLLDVIREFVAWERQRDLRKPGLQRVSQSPHETQHTESSAPLSGVTPSSSGPPLSPSPPLQQENARHPTQEAARGLPHESSLGTDQLSTRPFNNNGYPPANPLSSVGASDPPALRVDPQPITHLLPGLMDGWHFLQGLCNICGQDARFFFSDPSLYREQLVCEHCRSTSRYRSIARGILMALQEFTGIEVEALALLPQDGANPVRIYDTQQAFRFDVCAYPIPDYLNRCGWINLTMSSYDTTKPLGSALSPNATNQDLERLTFPDNSFDIVVTSDVMEHVRLDTQAHSEIARVLRPKGIYLFTVPHNWTWPHSLIRVKIVDPADPASDVYLLPPEYHGDANSADGEGVLAYRAYGRSLQTELEKLGYTFSYNNQDFDRFAIKNTELFYCQLA